MASFTQPPSVQYILISLYLVVASFASSIHCLSTFPRTVTSQLHRHIAVHFVSQRVLICVKDARAATSWRDSIVFLISEAVTRFFWH